jgi:hypothetical protein
VHGVIRPPMNAAHQLRQTVQHDHQRQPLPPIKR